MASPASTPKHTLSQALVDAESGCYNEASGSDGEEQALLAGEEDARDIGRSRWRLAFEEASEDLRAGVRGGSWWRRGSKALPLAALLAMVALCGLASATRALLMQTGARADTGRSVGLQLVPEADDTYLNTFRQTGCPEPSPSEATWHLWKSHVEVEVWDDMYVVCQLALRGQASAEQSENCCGSPVDCSPMECMRQTSWTRADPSKGVDPVGFSATANTAPAPAVAPVAGAADPKAGSNAYYPAMLGGTADMSAAAAATPWTPPPPPPVGGAGAPPVGGAGAPPVGGAGALDAGGQVALGTSEEQVPVQPEPETQSLVFNSDGLTDDETDVNLLAAVACGDEKGWQDLDHGLVCGPCKVLVDQFDTKYKTCKGYCGSMGRTCTGAWEEVDDDCQQQKELACDEELETSDAICQCSPDPEAAAELSAKAAEKPPKEQVYPQSASGGGEPEPGAAAAAATDGASPAPSGGKSAKGGEAAPEEEEEEEEHEESPVAEQRERKPSKPLPKREVQYAPGGEMPYNYDYTWQVQVGDNEFEELPIHAQRLLAVADTLGKKAVEYSDGLNEFRLDLHDKTQTSKSTGDKVDIRRVELKCYGEQEWPDVDHETVCGACTVLVNKFDTSYGTCKAYCKTMGRECRGAWEEKDDDCEVSEEIGCDQGILSSDAICQCGGTAMPGSQEPVLEYDIQSVTLDEFLEQAFPGKLLTHFKKWNPHFAGGDLKSKWNCNNPNPEIYFSNPRSVSGPLFENKVKHFPMAVDYADTSSVAVPSAGHKQAVLGFTELKWPYYRYDEGRPDAEFPYFVISMDKRNYTQGLHYQFVECALTGWPAVSGFSSGEFPVRVILKSPGHGEACQGWDRAKAPCNLETSWGVDPEHNSWRNTVGEIQELYHLCSEKYECEIRQVVFEASAKGKQVPQLYLFKKVGTK